MFLNRTTKKLCGFFMKIGMPEGFQTIGSCVCHGLKYLQIREIPHVFLGFFAVGN